MATNQRSRVPQNCAFTAQHDSPDEAQTQGAPATTGLSLVNGGLQVVNPSMSLYDQIQAHLATPETMNYDFADQSLLSSLFAGRWVPLPYVYNALKTLRDIHKPIWRDTEIKNLHYILSPKPWDETEGKEMEETHKWWWHLNRESLNLERDNDINDGF